MSSDVKQRMQRERERVLAKSASKHDMSKSGCRRLSLSSGKNYQIFPVFAFSLDLIDYDAIDQYLPLYNSHKINFIMTFIIGSKPLQIWDKKVRNGHIKRITDPDIQSFVLEIVGTNVSTTFITCPADPRKTLGIKLPYLVMIVKNMKKYFTFEVQVKVEVNLIAIPGLFFPF